jgi:anthranilate phosphoribosyltransferase
MRAKAVRITVEDPNAIDMCGTGGDGLGTFNISTVASLVAAGAGVTVAKHGNRSVSSRCGSADLLMELGADIQIPQAKVESCINKVGVGFLFAPLFHPAMKYVGKARTELAVRTIFNMVGPITNPAGVTKQLVGAYAPGVARKLAGALGALDTERACVVHSEDGMDEVTVSGETAVCEVQRSGAFREYVVVPENFDLPRRQLAALHGGNARENAEIALAVLRKERTPARDVVLANAAFGIYVSGKCKDLRESVAMAGESIDSGRALNVLKAFVEFSKS